MSFVSVEQCTVLSILLSKHLFATCWRLNECVKFWDLWYQLNATVFFLQILLLPHQNPMEYLFFFSIRILKRERISAHNYSIIIALQIWFIGKVFRAKNKSAAMETPLFLAAAAISTKRDLLLNSFSKFILAENKIGVFCQLTNVMH